MLWATVILIADSERQCLLGVSARRMRVPLRSNSRLLFLQRRLLRVMVHHCTCRPASCVSICFFCCGSWCTCRPASCVSICFFAAGQGAPAGQLRLLRVMVAAGVSSTPIASRSYTLIKSIIIKSMTQTLFGLLKNYVSSGLMSCHLYSPIGGKTRHCCFDGFWTSCIHTW